ncbi:MAG: hypothetical protein ACXVWF_08010 [Actinomycetota bacterium]
MGSIGQPGYDDIRWFADLRPGNCYVSARLEEDGELREVLVQGLAIVYYSPSFTVPAASVPWSQVAELDHEVESFNDFLDRHLDLANAEPSGESFLLVELDGAGGVINDWVESSVDGAKEHGAARADAEGSGLSWEAVSEERDPAAFVRDRLGEK